MYTMVFPGRYSLLILAKVIACIMHNKLLQKHLFRIKISVCLSWYLGVRNLDWRYGLVLVWDCLWRVQSLLSAQVWRSQLVSSYTGILEKEPLMPVKEWGCQQGEGMRAENKSFFLPCPYIGTQQKCGPD